MAENTSIKTLEGYFADIANAVRAKEGTTEPMTLAEIPTRISKIPSQGEFTARNFIEMGGKFQETSYADLTGIIQFDYTSNVDDMSDMFYSCSSLTTIPLFDTSNVYDMNNMFAYCSSLTAIPLFDTSNVGDMSYMFYGCSSLTTIPQLDTSNVYDMSYMFCECRSLTTIPQLDTSNVGGMGSMFHNCKSLTTIPLFDTSNVYDMNNMFAYCSSLTAIPLFDTSNVGDMSGMFYACPSLTAIHMKNIGVSLDISSSTKFTREALLEIIGNLKTVTKTQTLKMGSTNLKKLTDSDKQVATDKGWTLA